MRTARWPGPVKWWGWLAVGGVVAGMWWLFLTRPVQEPQVPAPASGPAAVAAGQGAEEEYLTLTSLANALSSDDTQRRQAAEVALGRVPYQRRNDLKRAGEGVLDEHAKALVMRRVEQIDTLLATDPPPISLHVKAATLEEVAACLSEETGTYINAVSREQDRRRYTLDVENKPFWEVVLALHAQHPITFSAGDSAAGAFTLIDAWGGPVTYDVRGHFAMFVGAAFEKFEPNDALPHQRLMFGVAADPRMRIVRMQYEPSFGKDGAGQPVDTDMYPGSYSMPTDGHGKSWVRLLPPTATPHHVWKSVLLPTHFFVSVSDLEATVENVENGFEMKLGETTITGKPFKTEGMRTTWEYDAKTPGQRFLYAALTVHDASGGRGPVFTAPGSSAAEFYGALKPPFRVDIRVPAKVREVEVPFELRNIPLTAEGVRMVQAAATGTQAALGSPAALAPTLLWRTPDSAVQRAYPPAAWRDMPLISFRDVNFNDKLLAFYATGEERRSLGAGNGINGELVIAQDKLFIPSNTSLSAVALDGFRELWTLHMDNQITPPGVDQQNVVFGEFGYLRAVELATGKERWRVENAKGMIGLPAVSGETVYISDDNGNLAAFDLKTGKELLRVQASNALSSGPLVRGALVYVGTARGLLAADAATLTVRWTFEPPPEGSGMAGGGVGWGGGSGGPLPTGYVVYILPAPVLGEGIIYHAYESALYAVDAVIGKLRWTFAPAAHAGTSPATTSRPSPTGVPGVMLHEFADGKLRSGGMLHLNDPTQPLLADGVLYVGAQAGVFALEAATGKERWFYPSESPVIARPALAGQALCVALASGQTIVLQLPGKALKKP